MNLKKISKLGWGSLLLAGSSLLSRMLGVLRDSLFAQYFGASNENPLMDINTYFAAFKLPDLIYTLLIMGALSAAFIPMYSEIKLKNEQKADEFASNLLSLLLLTLSITLGVVFLLTPQILDLLLPGYNSSQLEVTVELVRIMLIAPLLFTISSVFQGIENVHKRFLGIALAPVLYNLGIILACVFFAEEYGVKALAWGAVFGAFLHASAQLPGALKCGFKFRPSRLTSPKIKEFIKLSLPRIFGLSASQVAVLLDVFFTSIIGGGALAIYTYANNMQSLAYGVIGASVSIAVFSSLSERASAQKKQEFIHLLKGSTTSILFWLMPSILGIFVLSDEIIELILYRGEFTMADVQTTAQTVRVFIWAALGQSLIPLFARAFYSMKNTKTPVTIGIISVLASAAFSFWGIFVLEAGVWFLALSTVLSASLNAFLLLFMLKRELQFKWSEFISGKYFYIAVHLGLMCITIFALDKVSFPNLILKTASIAVAGAAVYLGGHTLTKTTPHLHKG